MKRLSLLAVISLLVLVSGCTQPGTRNTTSSAHPYTHCGQEQIGLEMIDRELGISPVDYTVMSSECELSRGGFIRIAGILKDGTPFEAALNMGACSSGGAGCGTSYCFSVESGSQDATFQKVLGKMCSNLSSYRKESWEDTATHNITYENETTVWLETGCLSGNFTRVNGSMTTFSMFETDYHQEDFGQDKNVFIHGTEAGWGGITDCYE